MVPRSHTVVWPQPNEQCHWLRGLVPCCSSSSSSSCHRNTDLEQRRHHPLSSRGHHTCWNPASQFHKKTNRATELLHGGGGDCAIDAGWAYGLLSSSACLVVNHVCKNAWLAAQFFSSLSGQNRPRGVLLRIRYAAVFPNFLRLWIFPVILSRLLSFPRISPYGKSKTCEASVSMGHRAGQCVFIMHKKHNPEPQARSRTGLRPVLSFELPYIQD
ncbi:hypothetical protein LZ30DRAFT_195160 [Colletotrichum cereale]|nr:hypothetical protein LZ30DRAFT_195160 [Colletotrichum cereale]